MTGYPASKAFLRQLSAQDADSPALVYPLSLDQDITIGRDPRCQLVLDSALHAGVSRRHVTIRVLVPAADQTQVFAPDLRIWEVCDLESANGTFINGQRLYGCQELQVGDRIKLGQNGPEFLFETQPVPAPSPVSPSYGLQATPVSEAVTFTQLFPILSTGRDLERKAYLIPGMITVGFVVLMFAAIGDPLLFNLLLALYLAGAAYYFIYRLCGKHKPWWVLFAAAVSTILILVSPLLPLFILIFRRILPGSIPGTAEVSFITLLINMFFGAGLMEELLKALPILGAIWMGRRLRSPWREWVGVAEPLDGILLGTASAMGFTLVETLGQYVPEMAEQAGDLRGLQILIPRVLGAVAGHMAYSGYLGYFIGLSVLKPRQRWSILAIGYFTASALHALWNVSGTLSAVLLALVGVLSYAFLAAAILKARALSPTRSQNFATRFVEPR